MLFQPRFLRCFSKSTKLGKFFPVKKDHTISEAFPKQHPKKLQSKNCDLILTEKPPTYITQSKTVPYELYLSKNTLQESPIHSKALDVALIGAPNVGKSSLLNKLTGDNISAVSNKSNTTDEAIKGVYTNIEKRTQIVFYDTPGIIQVYKNTRQYTTVAWDILSECDKALFIVDSTKNVDDSIKEALNRLKRIKLSDSYRKRIRRLKQETESDELTQNFIEEFRKLNVRDEFSEQIIPTYLILNKIDLCTNKRKLRWLINDLEDIVRFEKIHFTSAETGYGTNDLLRALELESFSRPWSFDQNCKSDLSEIQVLEQIIKAAIFERFYKEVPHRVGIQVTGNESFFCYLLISYRISCKIRWSF